MSPALPLADVHAAIVTLVDSVAYVLSLLIIVYVLLELAISFRPGLPAPVHELYRGLRGIFEPVFSQIRRVVPVIGGLDFSPLIALILLNVLTALVG